MNKETVCLKSFFVAFIYDCVYGCGAVCMPATLCMWQSEDNSQLSVLSFYLESSRAWRQVVGLGSKRRYPLGHLTDPKTPILKVTNLPLVPRVHCSEIFLSGL